MNNKAKYVIGAIFFVILSILGYLLLPKDEIVLQENNEIRESYIFVHIAGCVNEPGIHKVSYGTRLYELIEIAGGETSEADLSRVNLASILSDEQKVVIPSKVSAESEETTSSIVNINTASKNKLCTLSGIGDSTAEKIIKYREENGYFNTIEDLMKVPGIGESKFESLKNDIEV